MSNLLIIILTLVSLVCYIVLRKQWNKDFGTSWGGVLGCFVISLIPLYNLFTVIFTSEWWRKNKHKCKPPKWL